MELYATLGLEKSASAAEIKRAYLRLARETHPDKHADDPDATRRFQDVSRAYATLADAEKRAVYDATGIVDDVAERDAQYWREAFEKVTTQKLDEMKVAYQHTADELSDLKAEYVRAKGDMGKILDAMLFCTADDEARFRGLLQPLVESGELRSYRAFAAESAAKKQKRRDQASREAAEAEAAAKELGLAPGFGAAEGGDDAALRNALMLRGRERQRGFDAMLNSLEKRHGGRGVEKSSRGRGKAKAAKAGPAHDPLDDDAFAALQQKMMRRR